MAIEELLVKRIVEVDGRRIASAYSCVTLWDRLCGRFPREIEPDSRPYLEKMGIKVLGEEPTHRSLYRVNLPNGWKVIPNPEASQKSRNQNPDHHHEVIIDAIGQVRIKQFWKDYDVASCLSIMELNGCPEHSPGTMK